MSVSTVILCCAHCGSRHSIYTDGFGDELTCPSCGLENQVLEDGWLPDAAAPAWEDAE